MVSFLLAGFRSDFDPFITFVTTRAEPLSVDEIYGHLLSHEMRLKQHQASLDLSVAGANVATRGYSPNHPSRGMRGSHGHNSGRSFSSGTSRPFRGRGRGSSVTTHFFFFFLYARRFVAKPICDTYPIICTW